MSCRLLLIEDSAPRADAALRSVLASAGPFEVDRIAWDAVDGDNVCARAAQIVVAVAVPIAPAATRWFDWLRMHPLPPPTLAIVAGDGDESVLATVSDAADDFMLWPVRLAELQHRLRRLLHGPLMDVKLAHDHLMREYGFTQLVGTDPAFVRSITAIPLAARGDVPALITGETGTGKELCARAIHHLSKRRGCPFIAVDCSALPDLLFENELFGHARGAYTDAHADQKGVVAMAEGGTLFLDEIDSLSLASQAKMLRFLQERTFKPLGAERFHRADVNVIAASNADLEGLVRERRFRADLFFRLNVLRLKLPPLRERRADIEPLANHILRSLLSAGGTGRKSFAKAALRKLQRYDWPGNVRELSNIVQRATLVCDGLHILPEHLALPDSSPSGEVSRGKFQQAKAEAIATFERFYVEELLREHGGNVTRASRVAGKDRRAFGRLVKKYSIQRNSGT